MLENQKTRLEDASTEEIEALEETPKIQFPLVGAIVLGAIGLLMIICIIVIVVLRNMA